MSPKFLRWFFILSIAYFTYVSAKKLVSRPIVRTNSGRIKGYYRESYDGRTFKAFESIPYAKSPIGDLRFEPPVPVSNWSGILEATSKSVRCKQYNPFKLKTIGVEDCLFLNIYVPITKKSSQLPVLFWIPGGGFQYGSSTNYGPKYLMDRDVILVTLNYRLGVLGFLNTNDDVVPGNMGLKDQNLALRWIHKNIYYFGGDSKKITLAGVSAGGCSVHYHYLSPMSRGLFRNGISFSGAATNTFAYADNTTRVTKDLANIIGCPTDSSKNIVQCLKTMTTENIFNGIQRTLEDIPFPYALFPPVKEKIHSGYFMNKTPEEALESGDVYDVPWIIGVVEEDGFFITATFALKEDVIEYVDRNWTALAPYVVDYRYIIPKNQQPKVAQTLRKKFFGLRRFSTKKENIKYITRLVGDGIVVSGAVKAARMQAKVTKSPVRFYYYTYRANQSYSDNLSNSTENFGVCHNDDIFLVLENQFIDPTKTSSDREMLQNMLDYWYSIVSSDEPNLGVEWSPLDNQSDFRYMHIIGPNNYKMVVDNNFRDIDYWTSLGL